MMIIYYKQHQYLFYYVYLLILSSSIYLIQIYISIAHVTCCANEKRIKKIKNYERAVIVLYLNIFFPGSGSLMLGLSKMCDKDGDEDNRTRRNKKCIWKNFKYLLSGLLQVIGLISFFILKNIYIITSSIVCFVSYCFSIFSGIRNIYETGF